MSAYSNNQHLLTIPLDDILAHYGKSVVHKGYMYLSPFRDEKEPSMRVTVSRDGSWVWFDFGANIGGGCLDMVKLLARTDSNTVAFDVLRQIAESRGMVQIREEVRRSVKKVKPSGVELVSVSPVRDLEADFSGTHKDLLPLLCRFVYGRCIPIDILQKYCKEVLYKSKAYPDFTFCAVGFPNSADGFALRGLGKHKVNSKWGLSFVSPEGEFVDESDVTKKGDMFEGFTNFLSKVVFVRMGEPGAVSSGVDSCILHSASNVEHARKWVESHECIRTFFDNDDRGDKATEVVRSWCEAKGIDFKDGRSAYKIYNDINDSLVAYVNAYREQQQVSRKR